MSSNAQNDLYEAAVRHRPARGLLGRLLIRWQRERTRAVLESLSDDLLRDIGISRGEIPYIADRLTAPTSKPEPRTRERASHHVMQTETAG